LNKALLVAKPDGQGLGHLGFERKLLVLGEGLGCRTHGLDHALNGVLGHVQGELAGLDLGNIKDGIDEPQEVLAVGADTGKGVQ